MHNLNFYDKPPKTIYVLDSQFHSTLAVKKGLCQETKELWQAGGLGGDPGEKYLSVGFVRAQALCLVNRFGFIGEGVEAAAGRGDLAGLLEEGRRCDRQTHFLALVRGQGLSRVGQLFFA